MILRETPLEGVLVVEAEPVGDERGTFARVWCARELGAVGVEATWVQANVGRSTRAGTLRGLHHQLPPAAETKLVRCTRGALYDVVVDLRPQSETRWRSFGIELAEAAPVSVLVPPGCAHGYLTLVDETEISYLTSAYYAPELERGVNFADPVLGIAWPAPVRVVSERDRGWPLVEPVQS